MLLVLGGTTKRKNQPATDAPFAAVRCLVNDDSLVHIHARTLKVTPQPSSLLKNVVLPDGGGVIDENDVVIDGK